MIVAVRVDAGRTGTVAIHTGRQVMGPPHALCMGTPAFNVGLHRDLFVGKAL